MTPDTVGFTGREDELPELQSLTLYRTLSQLRKQGYTKARHGDCIGGDYIFHQDAMSLGFEIYIHPPDKNNKRAFCILPFDKPFSSSITVLPSRPYLVRDKDIAQQSHILIACPDNYKEKLRSGVWATVRYAREAEIPIIIIFPDGTTIRERP